MDSETRGKVFKLIMTMSFMLGIFTFSYAFMNTSGILCGIGFGLLTVMSALCTAGMIWADTVNTAFIRTSTRLSAYFFPLSVNGGGLIAEIMLINGMTLGAAITVIISAAVSVICAVVLVKRYMEDDF